MLTYVFGDTHGCCDLAMELVAKVDTHAAGRDHRRVWLGDYIDRGSQSAQLVTYLIKSKASRPQDVFLIGNHEDMLLANVDDWPAPYPAATRDILAKSFLLNGGAQTLSSYGVRSVMELPPDHLSFFKGLSLTWEDHLRFYVHAGVKPGVPLAMQDRHDLLWARGEFLEFEERFEKYIVHGHTPIGPAIRDNRCNLDAGVYINGTLTAGVFDDESEKPRKLLQVSRAGSISHRRAGA